MGTIAGASVEQYLSRVYEPDCDYVDGGIVERNAGEKDHSRLQVALASWFFARRSELGIHPYTEQRIRIA